MSVCSPFLCDDSSFPVEDAHSLGKMWWETDTKVGNRKKWQDKLDRLHMKSICLHQWSKHRAQHHCEQKTTVLVAELVVLQLCNDLLDQPFSKCFQDNPLLAEKSVDRKQKRSGWTEGWEADRLWLCRFRNLDWEDSFLLPVSSLATHLQFCHYTIWENLNGREDSCSNRKKTEASSGERKTQSSRQTPSWSRISASWTGIASFFFFACGSSLLSLVFCPSCSLLFVQSEEDKKIKENLEHLVQVVTEDPSNDIRRNALEALRKEIRSSTSSMTSVPKPLKFLRPHYPVLKEFYQKQDPNDEVTVRPFVLSLWLTSSLLCAPFAFVFLFLSASATAFPCGCVVCACHDSWSRRTAWMSQVSIAWL